VEGWALRGLSGPWDLLGLSCLLPFGIQAILLPVRGPAGMEESIRRDATGQSVPVEKLTLLYSFQCT
jgi:hypothetical protein